MSSAELALLILLIIAGITVLIIILYNILKNPFQFPYMDIECDVSRKRNPDIFEQIDFYLIQNGFDEIQEHQNAILDWEEECKKRIEKSQFKKLRQKQFDKTIDTEHAFQFTLIRRQTKKQQVSYRKTQSICCNYEYLDNRDIELSKINYACSLKQYEAVNQRKLMTREFREQIMKRDNYTCQICGKYMPDEVGLHVDHIIPIAKGGKSVPSNLQVLCDKCNYKKSTKTDY